MGKVGVNINRKLKGLFFVLRFDLLVHPFAKLFIFFANLAKLGRWISKHRKIGYSDFYQWKFNYKRRLILFEHVIENENLLKDDVEYFEFGVADGESFEWWMNHLPSANNHFHGFDTFTGLPEDWGGFKKGDMATSNNMIEYADKRYTFYQGLFQQTLPEFLKSYDFKKRKIIHIDSDLYTAALYVLTLFTPYLNKGDIIFFDEFNVPLHEFKAFSEWTEAFYIDYEVLGQVNNYYQIALKIK